MYHSGTGIFGRDWVDSNEKEKLVDVQTGLLSWIEEQSEGGTFPDGESIYKKVRELGVSVKVPDDIDRTVPPPIPPKSDTLYDPNDEDFEKLPSGTKWYDPKTKLWWEKK